MRPTTTPAPVPSGGLPNRWKLRHSCAQSPSNHCRVFASHRSKGCRMHQAGPSRANPKPSAEKKCIPQARFCGGYKGEPEGGGRGGAACQLLQGRAIICYKSKYAGSTKLFRRWLVDKRPKHVSRTGWWAQKVVGDSLRIHFRTAGKSQKIADPRLGYISYHTLHSCIGRARGTSAVYNNGVRSCSR